MGKSDEKKYIGLVKWFRDQVRNADYGFIQHAKLGDVFFHKHSVSKGQEISSFRENAIVVFTAQASKKHQGKLEAVNVKLLDAEIDLYFLFDHFLSLLKEKGKYTDYNIIQRDVYIKITSLIQQTENKETAARLFENLQAYVNESLQSETIVDEDYLQSILKVCKTLFPNAYQQIADLVEAKVSIEIAHKLWLVGLLDTCQIDFISGIILEASPQTKQTIFGKCTQIDKSNILFKVMCSFESIDTEAKLNVTKKFLQLSKEYAFELYEKILNTTIRRCPDYFKLHLWLEDYYEILDFDSYKIYTITLSPADQRRFVKKVLKHIHEERADISIEDLTSLNLIDFETSKLAEQIDGAHLDYSTSVILNVISELQSQTSVGTRNQAKLARQRIYELILKQIKEPQDILQIVDYFDECGGRCGVSVEIETGEDGEIISRDVIYRRNEYLKAKYHPICDGRKAVDRVSKTPLLSDEKVEFWWCANQKCFKPSRGLHSSANWEKYSLLDFLTILKVDFKESDLEIYLNIINKANRFLKHLKCRECNHILYPVGKTRYAFYGVNNFICRNETCSEGDKEIYLSHCLNGFCEMEIDSRDCVTCKPPGGEAAFCGWYVCNFCHSCCNSPQLEKRKWVYENILRTEYKCHLKGHRDLGIISCNKCGDSMDSNEMDATEYQRILNWFMTNKDTSDRIHNSGQNRLGKWWFVINRGNYSHESFREILNKYHRVGFQIPDFEKEKDLQLISEPIDFKERSANVLTCKNCGNILDLSNDPEKSRAIKKFHIVKFANTTVE